MLHFCREKIENEILDANVEDPEAHHLLESLNMKFSAGYESQDFEEDGFSYIDYEGM
jgi:hypothetical protein